MIIMSIANIRKLKEMPFDKRFETDNGSELCHCTGYEALIEGEWYNEYEDSNGNLHYGR